MSHYSKAGMTRGGTAPSTMRWMSHRQKAWEWGFAGAIEVFGRTEEQEESDDQEVEHIGHPADHGPYQAVINLNRLDN